MSLHFDDVESLRRGVSDEFGPWGPEVEVTPELLDRFADLTDEHPLAATIVPGALLVALMPRYLPPMPFEVEGEASRVNYGCESYRFLAPVPVGSTIHAHMRLVDVRDHPRGTLLVQELMVAEVGKEQPALTYTRLLLYKREQAV